MHKVHEFWPGLSSLDQFLFEVLANPNRIPVEVNETMILKQVEQEKDYHCMLFYCKSEI